uniref:Uncharacterized protein n=1 Tax=Siphoviridae sp. ctxMM9 TaxID=2827973 RepID=A0A8S5T6V9_9CAUD|nr:MAG TPA: Protein of unknown function (DUF4238) [Siphoviridae sp. ctxMM9]
MLSNHGFKFLVSDNPCIDFSPSDIVYPCV